ncbi:MAG: DoxX family membrane protein [Bacteroidota bacterium]
MMKFPILSVPALCLIFLAILFLQSGLDKVFNYKANKDWITSHFSKSPLKRFTHLLMPMITILEVAAGVFSFIGIFAFVFFANPSLGLVGAQLSCISVLSLFFGQRLAQDYVGAATLTTYFLISIVAIYSLS